MRPSGPLARAGAVVISREDVNGDEELIEHMAHQTRVLAVTGAKPSKFNPEWPTLQKEGVKEVDASNWTALYAPKGTPQAIIDKLNAEVVKILNMQDVKDRFAGGGVETIPSGAAELDARVKEAAARFKAVVDKANIRPD